MVLKGMRTVGDEKRGWGGAEDHFWRVSDTNRWGEFGGFTLGDMH